MMPSEVNSKPVWLIVGGSRGIGLEFVKQVMSCAVSMMASAPWSDSRLSLTAQTYQ